MKDGEGLKCIGTRSCARRQIDIAHPTSHMYIAHVHVLYTCTCMSIPSANMRIHTGHTMIILD